MRLLVIGGTRFIGRRVVEMAVEAGHEVTVVSRGNHHPPILSRVIHVLCDRADTARLRRALEERVFDAVIDGMARTGEDAREALSLLRGRAGRYVVTSSMSVYPHWDPEISRTPWRFAEDDVDVSCPSDIPYVQGKREVEATLAAEPSLDYAIIRPAIVMGPGDSTLRSWFFPQRALDGGPILIPIFYDRLEFTYTYVDDVARTLLAATTEPWATRGTFNIAHPEPLTLRSYFSALGHACGKQVRYVEVHPAEMPELKEYNPPLINGTLDTARAQKELRFRATPLEAWLRKTIEAFASTATASPGYERRAMEIEIAERFNPPSEPA